MHSCSEGVSVQMSCGVIRVSSRQGNGKKQKDVGFCGGSAGSSKGELVKKKKKTLGDAEGSCGRGYPCPARLGESCL